MSSFWPSMCGSKRTHRVDAFAELPKFGAERSESQKKTTQRESFGTDISGGRPGSKLQVGPRNLGGTNRLRVDIHDLHAQMSMTPWGCKKNFGQKNIALIFRSLE